MGKEPPEPDTEAGKIKRLLIGEPLPTEQLEGHLLPKRLALPVFASDALSSVAYGPQEMVMILLGGGLAFLTLAPWVALCVVLLLALVVLSYRQVVHAYPSGGGDYAVALANIGERPALVVAAALTVDYILTVAVSVASGVDNIISALPALHPVRVELAVAFVVVITAVNLRGMRESSRAFAIPVYLFIASVALMIVVGVVRMALGHPPVATSSAYGVAHPEPEQAAMLLLVLRSFASGCSALTGVEAIANGVPAFRKPKIANAQGTLVLLGSIAVAFFAGLTLLALVSGVHYAEHPCDLQGFTGCASEPQPSLVAQVAAAVFGGSSVLFFVVQGATAAVLLLAANTAFNGFPLLGATLARDGYAPKALLNRGDRLVYSNGCLVLALVAIVLLVAYRASVTGLIQLYIIGVFVSFTLGQTGMVRHWLSLLRGAGDRPRWLLGRLALNAAGAVCTAAVLVVVAATKFTHGAWIVFVLIPVLFTLLLGVNRYYARVEAEVGADAAAEFGNAGDLGIVLVGRITKPAQKALDYALAARHATVLAIHVAIDDDSATELQRGWTAEGHGVRLVILESPYRETVSPIADFIRHYRDRHGPTVVTVYLPQYIVGRWWEKLLQNRRGRHIRQHLMLVHGVSVTLVPWLLGSAARIPVTAARPVPGQARRGDPLRSRPRDRQKRQRERGPVAGRPGGPGAGT